MFDSTIKAISDWTSRRSPHGRKPSDIEQLVNRAGSGDQEAIGELYELYRTVLLALLARMDLRDPEDVVQELFIALPRKLTGYVWQGEASFGRWIKGVAYNMARMDRRSANRKNHVPFNSMDSAAQISSFSTKIARKDLLQQLLIHLPPAERELLVMSAEGFSSKELAALMKMSVSAINVRIHRARKLLRTREKQFVKLMNP